MLQLQSNTYNVGFGDADYDANKAGKNETEFVIPLKHFLEGFKYTID